MKTFEELHCWQKARDLAVNVYTTFNDGEERDVLKEMISTACFSIGNNIAMGHGQPVKSYMSYLIYAKGASAQLRSMLSIAKEIGFIDDKVCSARYNEAVDIVKMISGLIKVLRNDQAEKAVAASH